MGPTKPFSTDAAQGVASLKHLAEELQPRAAEVKVLATAHSGGVAGLAPLAAVGQSRWCLQQSIEGRDTQIKSEGFRG